MVAVAGPVAGPMLEAWLADRRRLADLEAQGRGVLDAEMVARRRHLRQLAHDPRLRLGLLLASPSLDTNLRTYLSAPDGPLGKRARRIERSILEYVYRTACKTSPFSTLTAVELGRIRPDGETFLDVDGLDDPWHSHVRLNLAAVARVVDVVLSNPELRNDLPVRITSGWRHDRDRIRYVRRKRTLGADDSAASMDVIHENLFYLTSGRLLEQVLDTLPDGEERRFGDLVAHLHTAGSHGYHRDDVETYVEHLLRLGLLTVPALHVDIHSADPVADLADRVRTLDRPWARTLSKRLSAIVALVATYRAWDLDDRRRVLEAVRQELVATQHDLGREEAATPQTLLYEDVTVGATVTASEPRWRADLVPALAGLSRILPVFDMVLPQRLVTQGFFRARYGTGGRCGDVLRFVHEFGQDFYEQYMQTSMRRREFDDDGEYQPQPNWLKLPELTALDEARRELVGRMRTAYAALPDPEAELVLDDDFIDGVAARLPRLPGDLDPRCFFLQVGADADGAPLAVLNRAYTGLTLLFSRFAHCFPSADDGLASGLRQTMEMAQPPGTVFAELKGGYESTNLNLHPAVTPYELVCPGDVSFRHPDEQIAVDDLEIVDDPDAGEVILRSRRLGVRVVPVYLGFLLPMALPEVQRLLLNFSYTAMARLDLWSGTDQPLGDRPIGGHPRVRYRNLVLQRRLWKTDPKRVPRRTDQKSDAEWMRDWVRWRHEHGLPRRAFVTVDLSGPEDEAPDGGARPVALGANKPQYVDFDSYFSLCLLDNVVKAAGRRVVFTEMLPDRDELWVRRDGQGYVSELTVEIDGLRGRTA